MYKLDNSLKRRVRRMPKMPLMMKISLSQSTLLLSQSTLLKKLCKPPPLNQLRNQSWLPQLMLPIPANKLGEMLTLNKPPKQLTNLFTLPSLLVISKSLTLFQTTSHQPKKTLSKVDTQQSFLLPLLNKNLCMQSMKTSNISLIFIPAPKVSDCSQ